MGDGVEAENSLLRISFYATEKSQILFGWLMKTFWPRTNYIYMAGNYKIYTYSTELLV